MKRIMFAAIAALFCVSAFAQDRGTFVGTVLDPTGAAVPNVKVGAVQISTNLRVDTVTNDAVAGDTVLPGPGDGNDGPTGGTSAEIQPILPDNELDGGDIHLDDERAGQLGSGTDAG